MQAPVAQKDVELGFEIHEVQVLMGFFDYWADKYKVSCCELNCVILCEHTPKCKYIGCTLVKRVASVRHPRMIALSLDDLYGTDPTSFVATQVKYLCREREKGFRNFHL